MVFDIVETNWWTLE